jgi:hypothetical protein
MHAEGPHGQKEQRVIMYLHVPVVEFRTRRVTDDEDVSLSENFTALIPRVLLYCEFKTGRSGLQT